MALSSFPIGNAPSTPLPTSSMSISSLNTTSSQIQPEANSNSSNDALPALYLYPINDNWVPKHIALGSIHTKIGRQTSSKTAPSEKNGFFDSKVLSRQHAEVWIEDDKILIKDVKSSNGTFINGERLSSEGQESGPFELKSDDIVEFGIDIVGDDNKTVIHHKVAARVLCVFDQQEAQVAARAEQHQAHALAAQSRSNHHLLMQHQQEQQQLNQSIAQGNSITNTGGGGGMVSPSIGAMPFSMQRKVLFSQPQGSSGGIANSINSLPGMGSLGISVTRPLGKSGLSFDVILSRLQGEVQKSRETGAELGGLTSAMKEICDTLDGNGPMHMPPLPSHLPPVRPPIHPPPVPPPSYAAPAAPGQPPSSSNENALPATTLDEDPSAHTKDKTISLINGLPPPPTSFQVNESVSDLSSGGNTSSDQQHQLADASAATSSLGSSTTEPLEVADGSKKTLETLQRVLAEQEHMRAEIDRLRGLVDEHEHERLHTEPRRNGMGFDDEDHGLIDDSGERHPLLTRPRGLDLDLPRSPGMIFGNGGDVIVHRRVNHRVEGVHSDGEDDDDDDDARSITTLLGHRLEDAHELETVEEEDEPESDPEERVKRRMAHLFQREGEDDSRLESKLDNTPSSNLEEVDLVHDQLLHAPPALIEFTSPLPVSSDEFYAQLDEPVSEEDNENEDDERHGQQEEDNENENEQVTSLRRREDELRLGRPSTPEPGSVAGMIMGGGVVIVGANVGGAKLISTTARRRSVISPLSKIFAAAEEAEDESKVVDPEEHEEAETEEGEEEQRNNDNIQATIHHLSAQLSSVLELTTSLEKQHVESEKTIQGLQEKVVRLETAIRHAEDGMRGAKDSTAAHDDEDERHEIRQDLPVLLSNVSSQILALEQRNNQTTTDLEVNPKPLASADDSEEQAKTESSLDIVSLVDKLAAMQSAISIVEKEHTKLRALLTGLATPPLPHSQLSSSDSEGRVSPTRFSNRRKKKHASQVNNDAASRTLRQTHAGGAERDLDADDDTDATLASSNEDDSIIPPLEGGITAIAHDEAARSLPTPEPSLHSSVGSLSQSSKSGSSKLGNLDEEELGYDDASTSGQGIRDSSDNNNSTSSNPLSATASLWFLSDLFRYGALIVFWSVFASLSAAFLLLSPSYSLLLSRITTSTSTSTSMRIDDSPISTTTPSDSDSESDLNPSLDIQTLLAAPQKQQHGKLMLIPSTRRGTIVVSSVVFLGLASAAAYWKGGMS